jgi:hypothetical protein
MSTRTILGRRAVKAAGALIDNLATFMRLNFLEPSGPVQPCKTFIYMKKIRIYL